MQYNDNITIKIALYLDFSWDVVSKLREFLDKLFIIFRLSK